MISLSYSLLPGYLSKVTTWRNFSSFFWQLMLQNIVVSTNNCTAFFELPIWYILVISCIYFYWFKNFTLPIDFYIFRFLFSTVVHTHFSSPQHTDIQKRCGLSMVVNDHQCIHSTILRLCSDFLSIRFMLLYSAPSSLLASSLPCKGHIPVCFLSNGI